MQKKDDKVGNKTANKEERQRKKNVRERQIKIDSRPHSLPDKRPNFGLCACVKNQKLFNDVRFVRKYAFFAKLIFFAVLMLISRKPVQRRGISENAVFSLLTGRHQRVKPYK